MNQRPPDPRTVFVVHGRNLQARDGIFALLRALGLKPLEWSQAISLTGKGSPFIGEILDHAFDAAQAVVVLLTPDEITYLRIEYAGTADPETQPAPQARPNVLFEAGMAFGRHPDRTILVELGSVRPFSDIAGRHTMRLTDDASSRKQLAQRLKDAGCEVDTVGDDWLTAGGLEAPPPPGGGLPLGRRVPKASNGAVRVTARYSDRGKGSGRLQVTNHCSFALQNLTLELPEEAGSFNLRANSVAKLPAGETASFIATRYSGPGADHFEIVVRAEHEDGTPTETTAFVNLLG